MPWPLNPKKRYRNLIVRFKINRLIPFLMGNKNGYESESRLFGELCGTADFKEGTGAFLEKRKPNFSGK